jgi:hypothetical protein
VTQSVIGYVDIKILLACLGKIIVQCEHNKRKLIERNNKICRNIENKTYIQINILPFPDGADLIVDENVDSLL